MARIDWAKLKKDYLLDLLDGKPYQYESLEDLAEKNNITYSGNFKRKTAGWSTEKKEKQELKAEKVIEKTVEKEIEKEVDRNARILDIADRLADKIEEAMKQLEQHIVSNIKRTKTIELDQTFGKPIKEVTTEEEVKAIIDGIIDKQGLKTLTSALKDIKDINTDKQSIELVGKNGSALSVKIVDDIDG